MDLKPKYSHYHAAIFFNFPTHLVFYFQNTLIRILVLYSAYDQCLLNLHMSLQ